MTAVKTEIVAANKMDLPGAEEGLAALRRELAPDKEIWPISAVTGAGIPALVGTIARLVERAPAAP